jgi:uncharacterized protein (TIGR00299 family) protein
MSVDGADGAACIGWWHCLAGASGDMCLGAVIDAGAPIDVLQSAIDAIGIDPVHLSAEPTTRQGLAATRVTVAAPPTTVVRTWGNVRSQLEQADLDDRVRELALDVFARLARAEAQAHRVSVDQVHFHEAGALDAVADVVGTVAGLHALGVSRLSSSPVAVGIGMSRGEHGLIPIPGPAVLALLEEVQAPMYSGDVTAELCTPTGAALLAATVTSWGALPPMRVTAVGTGAGERDHDELPNILRLVVGTDAQREVETTAVDALVISANVDDLDPRLWPHVLSRLLDAGADDGWLTPILMKKGRPAYTVTALCPLAASDAVRRVLLTETSTIGLRETGVRKRALDRDVRPVLVDGETIAVKVAVLDGVYVNVSPEYDDVLAAADKLGRPVKAVLTAAIAAAATAGYAVGAPGSLG